MIETPRETKQVNYYVSNKARIKSVKKDDGSEHLLKLSPDKKGYMRASVKLDGGNYALYMHMQVARYWSKKKAKDTRYIHLDLNRKNNLPSNVVWVTEERWREYVQARAKKYGFVPHRKGGKPKLRRAEVVLIKKMLKTGKTRKKMIAKRFGVSHTQINRIEKGENWADVSADEK
jgi:hypothetical protein